MPANIGSQVDVTWREGTYTIEGEPYRRNSSVMRCIPKPALEHWKQANLRQLTIDTVLENLDQIRAIQSTARGAEASRKAVFDFVSNLGRGDSQAMQFGSEVHLMIEDAVQGKQRKYDFGVTQGHRNAANGAFKWLRKMGPAVPPGPVVEMVVFNPTYRIAGRLDYWHGPGTFTSDWKTGKALYADYAVQVTLYTQVMTHAIIPQEAVTSTGYIGTVIPWEASTAGEGFVVHLRKQAGPVPKQVNPEHQGYLREVIKAAITIDTWLDNTHTSRGSAPKLKALLPQEAP